MAAPPRLIIFDFDGVVADSETIANANLAAYLTELGRPTTFEDCLREFVGKRHEDMLKAVDRWLGRPRPPTFSEGLRARSREKMRNEVQPVAGVAAFLATIPQHPKCVASSSSYDWLDHCVDKFGFRTHFERNLFSATEVANGKPAPDIFLLAAARMGVEAGECLVIEDSPTGVLGARAAGMRTIGFLGGSHVRPGLAERLEAAGAVATARTYDEVAQLAGLL